MGPKGKPAAGGPADTEIKTLTLKVVGGEAPSNAVLSARLAPFGCNPKKSGEEIAKQTKDYTNIRIYATLHIQAREIKKVDVLPTCSAYIIKELKEPVRQRRKVKAAIYKHSGNIGMAAIKKIGQTMLAGKSLARTLKGAVKEVLGSCVAIGCTVDGKSPKVVTGEVDAGKHGV
jgi:large subunit ribosomal protein L12e